MCSSRGGRCTPSRLVADAVEADAPGSVEALSLRMQQAKMRLRCTINAILDVRVHARGMTRAEARALMTDRGHQEDGEAEGKWRRALLTSAQLSTYYVGASEVGQAAAELAVARPGATPRAVHDEPAVARLAVPRLLRLLLDVD
ncbi:hypothetical protein GCM10025868_14350 [Angustibacter aerolatus]|uniref:DUF222 domain-containing protein n=1 Tax=Angustibacter aerolatus TaxID=1162965 RepID=A0ABQ6JH60_9ACTN|nr:hypothetical protein GCM10025868_14350 [Angustibacter aerolatus]